VLSADRRVVVCLLVMTGKAHASHRQMSKSVPPVAPAAKPSLNCSPTDHSFTLPQPRPRPRPPQQHPRLALLTYPRLLTQHDWTWTRYVDPVTLDATAADYS
jgi:hypothetical protein